MGKRREVIKTLTRRKEFLGNRLRTEEYGGRDYDLAEYNALVFVLRGLEKPEGEKMKENMECYNSGWQDGFVYALNAVIEAINRNYNEADREGDDEYINERITGWENVKNTINEMKESYLGEENGRLDKR